MINTLRCLVGCTVGDFSAMWYLQAAHPELGIGTVMAISSKLRIPGEIYSPHTHIPCFLF